MSFLGCCIENAKVNATGTQTIGAKEPESAKIAYAIAAPETVNINRNAVVPSHPGIVSKESFFFLYRFLKIHIDSVFGVWKVSRRMSEKGDWKGHAGMNAAARDGTQSITRPRPRIVPTT